MKLDILKKMRTIYLLSDVVEFARRRGSKDKKKRSSRIKGILTHPATVIGIPTLAATGIVGNKTLKLADLYKRGGGGKVIKNPRLYALGVTSAAGVGTAGIGLAGYGAYRLGKRVVQDVRGKKETWTDR